jgi:glycosyltransferase involved in cell wall biosynthesis
MRIGILPALSGSAGGVYQYSLALLRALPVAGQDDFVVFTDEGSHPILDSIRARGWQVAPAQPPSRRIAWTRRVSNILGDGAHREAYRWLRSRFQRGRFAIRADCVRYQPVMNRWFRSFGVELMMYPAPNELSFESRIPYVMAIHDLQHRLQPEFPEVSANGRWERREYLFRNGACHATLVLADSETGREDILNFYGEYGVEPDRVKVLPYLPPPYLPGAVSDDEIRRTKSAHGLPERYVFYPAQFWPHKNHLRIVRALGLLKQRHGAEIPIVFCGAHRGQIRTRTWREVRHVARELGLDRQVRFLGYVPDEDMAALYAGATALVMPTFFGPTNIPILEAWRLQCPVLTSDIRGIREQTGNAAVLVEPRSIEAIADGIYRLWTRENLRHTLIACGRERLSSFSAEDYRRRLTEILTEAKLRVGAQRAQVAQR